MEKNRIWKTTGKMLVSAVLIMTVIAGVLKNCALTGYAQEVEMQELQNQGEKEIMDYQISLLTDEEKVNAGGLVHYHLMIENTGTVSLEQIQASVSSSDKKLELKWDRSPCQELREGDAFVSNLEPGGVRMLNFYTQLYEGIVGTLQVSAEVSVHAGMDSLKKTAAAKTEIQQPEAAFTVKKTASSLEAEPGETIDYQICIRNTGERTLHSVISTERFANADIQAHFMETGGVKLSADRTKAKVDKLMPGACIRLKAQVILPEKLTDKNLINEVIVTTDETEESGAVTAQSEIAVKEKEETGEKWAVGAAKGTGAGYYPGNIPKTGDRTVRQLYEILMVISIAVSGVMLWHRFMKGKSNR